MWKSGGEVGAATERRRREAKAEGKPELLGSPQRRREVGCFLARVATAVGDGNSSDAKEEERAEGSGSGAYS